MTEDAGVSTPTALSFLADGGEVGRLIRSLDWSRSPLGPPEGWPQSLKSVVGLMTASKFPMFLAWGEELRFLYNDAYTRIIESKHPAALGAPFARVWPEVWDEVRPLVEAALRGDATYLEELPLTVNRRGYDEQAWFTFSYSPVRDEAGAIAGMFCTVVEVSEQHRARDALARSRSELKELTDALPVLVSVVDEEGRYRFVNRLYEDWFPHSREAIQGRLVREVVGEAAFAAVKPWMDRAMAGERLSFEQFMPYAEGGRRYIRVEYIPRFGADGQVHGFYALVEDISQAKQAEAAHRQAVEEARAAAERVMLALNAGAIVGSWVWDVRNDHFLADPQFAASFGLDPELCRNGLSLDQVMASIHPDDTARVAAAVSEALGRGGFYRCEYRVLRRDGAWRWVEASGEVELGEDGAAARFPGVLVDVHERRSAEDALTRANSLLRTFMSAVPGVIYAKDLEGRLLVGNRGVEELLGRRYDDFVGRTDMELLEDKAEAAAVMATDRRIMETGVPEQIEERVTFADGTEAWWHSTKAPLLSEGGEVIGLVGSSVDITERRRGEEHRQLLVNELNHRVKNTLAVVQALARQTFRNAPDVDVAVAAFDERLFALSRAHNLLTDANWSAADLRDIIAGQIGQIGERVLVDGPPVALPPQLAVSLALALHELHTNATKYGALSNDAGRVQVSWRIAQPSGRLHLCWKESGGPPVAPPTRQGFGSRLIERALAREVGGEVQVRYLPDGVVCEIEVEAP